MKLPSPQDLVLAVYRISRNRGDPWVRLTDLAREFLESGEDAEVLASIVESPEYRAYFVLAQRGYCQLKSNLADFLPRASNLNAEQSISYEFAYCLNFVQIHLT